MNIKQYLSEEKLIDNVARIVPWFAPLIPASFAYHNSVRVLELAKIEAFLVAFVVELLGLATVHTFFSLAESMKTAKENKPKHETVIMGFMAVFYGLKRTGFCMERGGLFCELIRRTVFELGCVRV